MKDGQKTGDSSATKELAHVNLHHSNNGYLFPNFTLDSSIEALQSFTVCPDDVWIVTYPKSGTHWMLEIVGLINARGNLDKVNRSISRNCIEMIDISQEMPLNREEELTNPPDLSPFLDKVERAPSPRVIQSHLHLEALPPTLLDTAKVIYVARNPKDVLNSYYSFLGKSPRSRYTWGTMFEEFISDYGLYGPWPRHVESFWKAREKENVLFVFYEDLKQDPFAQIRRVADHLGAHLSEGELQKVVDCSSLSQMKKTYTKIKHGREREETKLPFINKGVVGDWRRLFTVAQNARFDEWYREEMGHLDITFQLE